MLQSRVTGLIVARDRECSDGPRGPGIRVSLDSFIETTLKIDDPKALATYFVAVMRALQFDLISYHHIAELFRRIPLEKGFRIDSFPKDWVEHYTKQRYFDDDPIMLETRKRGAPFRWFDIETSRGLTPRQKQFFVDLRAQGFKDGVAVPVFSRPGDIAYFGLGSTTGAVNFADGEILELQAFCQQLHVRYNDLVSDTHALRLSPRETEVLELIAQGHSNAAIAEQLEVTIHTVDTLVRRAFEKLGVTTRVEAALSAIGRGLILP